MCADVPIVSSRAAGQLGGIHRVCAGWVGGRLSVWADAITHERVEGTRHQPAPGRLGLRVRSLSGTALNTKPYLDVVLPFNHPGNVGISLIRKLWETAAKVVQLGAPFK